jgi:excisionase family DNA binding protein
MSEVWLTVEEVAARLQVSPSWIYKKVTAKIMPHIRVGGLVRFSEKEINDWLQSHHVKGCQKI